MRAIDVKTSLKKLANPERAKGSERYFKTGKGQYGEGDIFIGVTVPLQRSVAHKYVTLSTAETIKLLRSPIHEFRLTALFILVEQYRKGDLAIKKEIADIYFQHRAYVNNWDLVDSSAPQILGDYLFNRSSDKLTNLAKSQSIWDRRIAILASFKWIDEAEYSFPISIISMLLNDR